MLHAHGVTRAANGPKTLAEAECLQAIPAEEEKIVQFADSILSSELPITEPHNCAVSRIPLSEKESVPGRAQIRGSREPFMLYCELRSKEFTPSFLNRRAVLSSSKVLQDILGERARQEENE